MMKLMLTSVAAAGLLIGGWAVAGENCQKTAAAGGSTCAKAGGCCGSKTMVSAEAQKALDENAAWQQSVTLLKNWSEAPAKLVAMNESDKAELKAGFEKANMHPAVAVMHPSMVYVQTALATAAKMDKAAMEMCGASCKTGAKTEGAAVKASADGEKMCPKMKAAKLRMEQSAAMVAQASRLVTVACKTAGEVGEKMTCKKASANGEGGCPKAKAAAMAAKSDNNAEIVKVSNEGGESSCTKTTQAKAEGEKLCPKSLSAKAEALINDSGRILAQWQEAGVVLASMDDSARTSLESTCATAMSKCPAGSLMPQTMTTARELLVQAARLTAQCQAECSTSQAKAEVPAEMKDLMKARMLLISSAINVLDRTCTIAKPAKQIAAAQ